MALKNIYIYSYIIFNTQRINLPMSMWSVYLLCIILAIEELIFLYLGRDRV